MSQIRVLIVEDEPLIANDISEYLTNVDYEVTTLAYDKDAALESLAKDIPDIVLLDINLGGNMHGFEIADFINSNLNIPFIFLTSYSSKSVIGDAKFKKPMGYIVKPFDESDLYSSIEIALFNHSQLHRPKEFTRALINENLIADITSKEFEILQDLYEGSTNKAMAAKHFLSINTIKTHIQKIYEKMDTHTRSETIALIRKYLT